MRGRMPPPRQSGPQLRRIRDSRAADVVEKDIHLGVGGAITDRTRLQISFRYESGQ
jgi:hypothetical protein